MYKFDDDIGEKIRLCRMTHEVSKEQLGKEIGKTADYISKLERGDFKPSVVSFVKICRGLGVTPGLFFKMTLEDFESFNSLMQDIKKLDKEHQEKLMEEIYLKYFELEVFKNRT